MSRQPETLHSDRPESDPVKDLLGYSSFAKHLADATLKISPSDGLVIGIYGPWGSGKTTLLNFIRHYLDLEPEVERPLLMEFNPWWFSGAEELTRRFFEQLLIFLGKKKAGSDELRNSLADLGELVSKAPAIPLPAFAEASLGIKLLGPASKLLRPVKRDIVKLRDDLARHLRSQKHKLVIVVDDIDRLTAHETRELFRLVKSVANFPNTIFILAFDREATARALDKFQEGKGDEYLEKIVQVPFELPLPDKVGLRRMLTSRLDSILANLPQEKFDTERWREIYFEGLDPLIRTPRQIVRWINTLSVTYLVVAPEVNAVDFVAVEGLRVFFPELYDIVRQNIDAFTRQPLEILGMNQAAHKQFHDGWMQRIAEGPRGTARSLISHLFPYVGSAFSGTSLVGDESAWRRNLRVCSQSVFPTYFRLATPEGVVSNTEFQGLLATANDPAVFGRGLQRLATEFLPEGRSRVRDVLERLVDHAEEGLPNDVRTHVLNALADVGNDLLLPADTPGGLLEFDNSTLISRVIYRLTKPFDQETRFRLLFDAYSDGRSLGLIVHEISILGQEHGKHTSSQQVPRSENERIVSAAQLAKLEELGLKRIREAAASGSDLLDDPLLGAILHRWREWGPPEEAASWVAGVVASDDGLIRFLERSLIEGWSSQEGRTYDVDPASISVFVDPASLVDRARALVGKGDLKDRQVKAMGAFLRHY